ncbi:MAG: hypothetical protein HY898_01090 [Deltaproteobacteria bacterium]|nr:hypothetical protein [Deltaproteobacteria bacterium]
MKRSLAAIFIVVGLASCGYRPARYADACPVLEARDDKPIPLPRSDSFEQPEYLAEVYMRRPIMDALDTQRIPEPVDVNSIDEVVRSSWFVPDRRGRAPLDGYAAEGPPQHPLRVAGGLDTDSLGIVDARGLPYRLRTDVPDRPEMRTAADAITSRLLWAIGYFTPEVHVIQVQAKDFASGAQEAVGWLDARDPKKSGWRVTATRWPIGTDLGPAPATLTRSDDPNDRLPHRDRRTLRSLRVLGAWLDFKTMGPRKTIDAYVGLPGAGHVVHYLTGFEDTLGAARMSAPPAKGWTPRADCGGNPLLNLATLGLAPDPPPSLMERKYRTLGAFEESVDAEHYRPELPPWEPMDHALPADGYWAARRMLALDEATIRAAVDGGKLDEAGAAARLIQVLEARRTRVAAWWFSQVTPVGIDFVRGGVLRLHDDAVGWGMVRADATSYRAEFVDDEGEALTEPVRLVPGHACWEMQVPAKAIAPYLVVRLTALRQGVALPRPAEFHLVGQDGTARLVGIRH